MSKNEQTTLLNSIIAGALSALIVSGGFFLFMQDDDQSQGPFKDQDNSKQVEQSPNLNKDYISQEDLVITAVEKASPAVVSIVITKDVPILEQYYEDFSSPFDDPFFGGPSFNFQIPKYRESGETEEQTIGGGSGFLVSEDGYIITNNHVVDQEEAQYTVFTLEGEEYEAEVIDKDALNDIAILKIEGKEFPYLDFSDSDSVKPGQSVIAIGNPLLEFNNSVSVGVVSGLSRNITAGTRFFGKTEYLEDVIQTDAAINPGNSGGPLLNLSGEVVAVNVAIANGENIGFSIPANIVKSIYDSVKENGRIIRPFLGIRYVPITETLKEKNNLEVDHGVLITRGETMEDLAVIPGSPADKAGLMENDIVLEIDGEKLDGTRTLSKIVSSKTVGEQVKLKVLHKGEEKTVTITLEEQKESS